MVRALLLFLLLAPYSASAMATARISVHADKRALALGEALRMEIRIDGVDTPALDAFTLKNLNADFDVADVSTNLSLATKTATITATLYPLRIGVVHIPILTIAGASSRPVALTVSSSGPYVPRVLIRTGLLPAKPRVREAGMLYLDVYDNGTLQWSPVETPHAPGIHLRALTESQREEVLEGTRYVVRRHSWAAMPLRDGTLNVSFPVLHAVKFGTRLRYAAPPVAFHAESIPAYLPTYLPVGRPELSAVPLPVRIETGRPLNWELRVTGTGLSEAGIATMIASSLLSNDTLHFYTPAVRVDDTQREDSLSQTLRVTIPFQILQAGDIALPALSIAYYDPQLEQVRRVRLEPTHVIAENSAARFALRVAAALVALLLAGVLAYWLRNVLRRWRLRRTALRRIAVATDFAQLKSALFAFGVSSGPAATLQRWLPSVDKAHDTRDELTRAVQRVERACYGADKKNNDFAGEKKIVFDALKRL